jgi:hypothetical protein
MMAVPFIAIEATGAIGTGRHINHRREWGADYRRIEQVSLNLKQ